MSTGLVRARLEDHPQYPHRTCKGATLDGFYPRDGERQETAEPRLRRAARRHCRNCPLMRACRDAGQQAGGWGVWGGTWYRREGNGQVRAADLLARRTR